MSFCVREHIKPGLVEDIKQRKKFPEADMIAELFINNSNLSRQQSFE